MIPRQALIKKLRELGYSFKRETEGVSLYKGRTNRDFVPIPKKELLDLTSVKGILNRAGMSEGQIQDFIAAEGNAE